MSVYVGGEAIIPEPPRQQHSHLLKRGFCPA